MIGLGVLTCKRPDYLRQVLDGIREHLTDVVDAVCVYEDGPCQCTNEAPLLDLDLGIPKAEWLHANAYTGIATGKNWLMRRMLDLGCETIFVSEDDVVVQSPLAITGYVDAMEASGWQHLAFHAHGPANDGGPTRIDGPVTYWGNFVGAWCSYTRQALEVGGLMDEGFSPFNNFEHCEHTLRLAIHGFHPFPEIWGCPLAADATGAEEWIKEIPGSIENSAILRQGRNRERFDAARAYWKAEHPDTYSLLWRL